MARDPTAVYFPLECMLTIIKDMTMKNMQEIP